MNGKKPQRQRRPEGCGPGMAVLGGTGAAHKKETNHILVENPSSIRAKHREKKREADSEGNGRLQRSYNFKNLKERSNLHAVHNYL